MEQALTIQVSPLLALIPLAPLFGALACAALIRVPADRQGIAGWIATLFSGISFYLTLKLFGPLAGDTVGRIQYTAWSWVNVADLDLDLSFIMDKLSGVMTLVVTGVGSLIHLYSIGYMAEDGSRARFFAYLNLFLAAMLVLVLGGSLPVTFIGWEGVGLCSYLLIGFWFKDMINAEAGQKAFVINRIGDAGLLLGMFFLFLSVGALDYVGISTNLTGKPSWVFEVGAMLLLIGAIGKSAQIPLHVWLPDAMAGPTPVSALIHAATMVTAGVYLVARMSFLFSGAPVVSGVIAILGAATALMAATIALVQFDIKKVLAYSTVSQLGFMFLALGVGAYSTAIFHVVTHAFFKACLFMSAGSVIVGCHHEQDMRRYGGLCKMMPVTFFCYLVATLAIAGLPFTSGYYSKDAILWSVYAAVKPYLFWVAVLTAFLTAFYMVRSLVMTFFGSYRGDAHHKPHETAWTMLLPLLILAGLSAGYGYFAHHSFLPFLGSWTRPDLLHSGAVSAGLHFVETLSSWIAIGGIVSGIIVYSFARSLPAVAARQLSFLHKTFERLWFIDALFYFIADRIFRPIARMLSSLVDRVVLAGTVLGVGETVLIFGDCLKIFHRGRLNIYLSYMLIASVFLTFFWLVL
jgi:NADH-quinone oxidoreductase subunit L